MEKYDVEVNGEGTVRFYKKGTNQLHRLDGPAVEWDNGDKYWYQDNKLNRLDGPAIEYTNGHNIWYIEGKEYTEEEFKEKIASLNTKEMTIAGIEAKLGHKVKIVK